MPLPPAEVPRWVRDLRSEGLGVSWSATGHAWMRTRKVAHIRFPANDTSPVGPAERSELQRRGRLVLQHHHPAAAPDANAWLYLCDVRGYSLDVLSANNRSKARRGRKRFDVRPVTCDEVAATGYGPYADTRRRHGSAHMSPAAFQRLWGGRRLTPSHEVWGAVGSDGLAAFGEVQLCGRWAALTATVSSAAALRDYPNHALFTAVLEDLLARPGIESVSYGLSSLRPETARDSLHAFKASVGLTPVPVRREIEVHPLLRPLVGPAARGSVHRLERRLPGNRLVRSARAALVELGGEG